MKARVIRMANKQSITVGNADNEAALAQKLAALVEGVTYPFEIEVANKAELPLVFPHLSGEVIEIGGSITVRIDELWQVNDLLNSGAVLGEIHNTSVMIEVSRLAEQEAQEAKAAEADTGGAA
jgi:hypothetical protein